MIFWVFFNIKAQLEYALCIFIKYYLHLCPDYFNYPGSYFFIKKGFSSLLGLIILAPLRAKFCNSKGDTRQTGKGLNCLTVFSVEQAVLLKLIRLFKLLSTQHNCTIYLCYFWLIGLCNPLVCWHDFGHLYWKLAFKCTHMHTLLFTSFFLLFFPLVKHWTQRVQLEISKGQWEICEIRERYWYSKCY